jgi:lipopolysaccharide export system protein LptA
MVRRRLVLRVCSMAAPLVLVAGVGQGGAQEGCILGDGTRSFQVVTLVGSDRITYISRPRFICDGGVRIQADSAVSNSALGFAHFTGNVRYVDRTRELEADEARYFSREARLQAAGHLFVRDTERGSIIENGNLVYLRQASFRDEEEMTVTTWTDRVRPRALLMLRSAPDTAAVMDTTGAADTAVGTDSVSVGPPDTTAVGLPDSAAVAAPARQAPSAAVSERPESPPTPYRVTADRLFFRGDRYFEARRDAEIERDSLHAFSDRVEYDQELGRILLDGSARVEGTGYDLTGSLIEMGVTGGEIETVRAEGNARVEGSGYDLTGRVIHLDAPGGEIRTVQAIRDGVLTGDQLRLTSPEIRLFLNQGVLDRLVATPLRTDPEDQDESTDSADLKLPVAVAEDFRLTADSLDVIAPAQALERIVAVGRARGESMGRDSLNVDVLPEIALHDWLEGDTVIAIFVPEEESAAADTAQQSYRLDQLMAHGNARSLYRLAPSDSAFRAGTDPPAVHYVTGSQILIAMAGGEVDRMEVEGPARGWHLEPGGLRALADSVAAADSLAVPDTALALPDTGAVPDTIRAENGRGTEAGSERPGPRARAARSRLPPAEPVWVRRRRRGSTTPKESRR